MENVAPADRTAAGHQRRPRATQLIRVRPASSRSLPERLGALWRTDDACEVREHRLVEHVRPDPIAWAHGTSDTAELAAVVVAVLVQVAAHAFAGRLELVARAAFAAADHTCEQVCR